jgi:hypothetical protein
MESKTVIVNAGKYKFQITDNKMTGRGVNHRNFKIAQGKTSCVDVSVDLRDENNIVAVIPNVEYNPECSIGVPLERGVGSVLMCKTLFDYVHKQFPTLTELNFADKSKIECANEDEIKNNNSKNMKPGSFIKPADLYYFYILHLMAKLGMKNNLMRDKKISKNTILTGQK